MKRTVRYLALLALFLGPLNASADAIVRSMAMFASTIAEYYIEEDRIRVELEIGEADIPVFRNLLPDEIHQQLVRRKARAVFLTRFFHSLQW